jgi:broad specificity phosphatase PhoE
VRQFSNLDILKGSSSRRLRSVPPKLDPWESEFDNLAAKHEEGFRKWATSLPSLRPTPSPTIPQGINIERGSSSIPLIDQGREQIKALGHRLAARGKDQIKAIHAPNLPRTVETAQILARITGAPIKEESPDWQTQRMGWMEGMPSDEIRGEKTRLRRDAPDEVPPGMGPFSTEPGESTNQFLHRRLAKMDKLMQAYRKAYAKDPDLIWIVINHYSGIKADEAWLKKGMPKDYSVDVDEFMRHDGDPGEVHRLYLCSHGDWHLQTSYDVPKEGKLAPGIYVIRHGLTAWNEEAKVGAGKKDGKVEGKVEKVDAPGLNLAEQAQIHANLREVMRTPGWTRLPSTHREKIQSARLALAEKLPKELTREVR